MLQSSMNKIFSQRLKTITTSAATAILSCPPPSTSTTTTTTTKITNNITPIIQRSKHSKTQIKRIFQNNPAAIRVATRNQTLPKAITSPPPPLTIQPFFEPNILPNGWSAPPVEENILQKRNELPFRIQRTGNKPNDAIGFLPVYSSTRIGGTKRTTIIKKVSGDKELFVDELRAVLGIGQYDLDSIRIRASGSTIEVKGNRVRDVKMWLAGLGF